MRLLRPRTHVHPQFRRGHAEPRPAALVAATTGVRTLAAEHRLRASGGPEDHATYACRCGAVFPAAPTTSVSCPLCGIHQAW